MLEEIEKLHTSEVEVRVFDAAGQPAPGVEIRYELLRHDLIFGTAVAADLITGTGAEAKNYRRMVLKLFNTVVFENEHKWKYWEAADLRPVTDAAVSWVRENHLRLRGHTMIWQTWKYGVPIPKDVELAVRSGDPERRGEVRDRTLSHIAAIGGHYRGIMEEWDVLNEQVEEHELTAFLNPRIPFTEAPAMAEWFQAARRAAPEARLFINDFHILVGDFPQHKDDYEKTIRFLIDQGAPLGGIGFQGHFHSGKLTRTPLEMCEVLDRFGKFGLPMLVTEFDMYGEDWGTTPVEIDQNKAEFFEKFLLTALSHPGIEGLMVWGFWDGRHWTGSSPFFRKDWSEKGALKIYRKYVLDAWRSRGTVTSGPDGLARFRGFHGTYRLLLKQGKAAGETTFRLSRDANSIAITLPAPKAEKP
ncbi:MAG: endo-1,4-beta-xylanase [Verrucomicrobiota bacterium]